MSPPPPLPEVNHTFPLPVPGTGTGLFASQDITPGDLIIRIARPLLAVPDSPHFTDTCSNCFVCGTENEEEDEVKLRKCGGCGVVRFCGETCQTQAWRHHHRYECRIFKRLYPNILPNTVRMAMQLLLRRKANNLPASDWETFLKLQHHLEDFRTSADSRDTFENIQLMAKAAKEYSGTPEPLGLVETLIGRILINTLTLTTPTLTPLGLTLSTHLSLLNHSCTPNTCITPSGPALSLRSISLIPIPKNTPLTISYIDHTNPPHIRRAELASRYFFTCTCPECEAGTTLGREDVPPALAAAFPSPKDLEKLEERASSYLSPARAATTTSSDDTLQGLNTGLALLTPLVKSSSYPPHRQPLPSLLSALTLALLSSPTRTPQHYIRALTLSLHRYFSISPLHYPVPFHPVRVVHNYTLLRLVLYIASLYQSGDPTVTNYINQENLDLGVVVGALVREVKGNVGRSHGVGSVFARVVGRMAEGVAGDMRGSGEVGMERVEGEWRKLRRVAEGAMEG